MNLDEIKEVAISISMKLESANEVSSKPCIFEVPECMRKDKEHYYRPSVVTIGPIHYENPPDASMQEMKFKYLASFLGREGNPYSLQDYIKLIGEKEADIRGCYAKKITLSRNVLIELVLIDAAFIIELFVAMFEDPENLPPDKLRFLNLITQDLLLVENQVPFSVVECLYNKAYNVADSDTYFIQYTCHFLFVTMYIPGGKPETGDLLKASDIKHLLDLLRLCWLPSELRDPDKPQPELDGIELSASASNLKAVGVKFRASKSNDLLDISFKDGILEIPRIIISETSETIFRNLLAHEQCLHIIDSYVADYLYFLDGLIDTPQDVEILVKSGIIQHTLGDDTALSKMINDISSASMLYNSNYYYSRLSRDLNSFAKIQCNRWLAVLRKDYFNHPWAIISVVYLILLLILTVLQVITGFICL